MAKMPRDVERMYSTTEVVAKLRRLADALEQDHPFRIQSAGERFGVPERAEFSIEHERDEDEEEVEFHSSSGPSSQPSTASTGRKRHRSSRCGTADGRSARWDHRRAMASETPALTPFR